MGPAAVDEVRPNRSPSGEHERHLAISTVVQQMSQVIITLAALIAITVLARRLTLAEFGTYALLVSLTAYVMFVQESVSTVAVKAIAEAADQPARDRAFSTAVTLYAVAGLVGGVLLAAGGSALIKVLNIPSGLHHQAEISVLILAALTFAGWPARIFQDVLRGSQRFICSASAEAIAYVAVAGALIGLALDGAPLWLLVGAGASTAGLTGLTSMGFVRRQSLPYSYTRSAVDLASIRSFLGLSGYLLIMGISDLVVYSLDRVILAGFRSASVVGLYEGPVRAHGLVRQIHGTLGVTVLPASARYLAEGDAERTRDLLIRGTRYTLAVVVPVTVVLSVLAGPILNVWLGQRFGVAATAMTVLVSYWVLNANSGVASGMLIAAGRVRRLAGYAAAVALHNLVLSLALTPSLGLNGVVLGTTISYAVGFPFFTALTISTFQVRLRDLVHDVWLPAYTTGAVLAGSLIAVRVLIPLDTLDIVLGVSLLALISYWAAYYAIWLRPNERALVKNVAWAFVRR